MPYLSPLTVKTSASPSPSSPAILSPTSTAPTGISLPFSTPSHSACHHEVEADLQPSFAAPSAVTTPSSAQLLTYAPLTYSSLASSQKSSSFSTRFLSKEPRGYPSRSSNPSSPESDSTDSSDYSSSEYSVSSASSSTSLHEPFYSKLAQIELAAQQLAPFPMPFTLPTCNDSTSSLSTIVPSPTRSSPISSLALLSKNSPSSPPPQPQAADDTPPVIPRRKSALKLVRHSSMPATTKMVHFDANLEQVCHFLHSEKPAAVSSPSLEARPKFHWGSDSDSSSDTDDEEDPRLGYQRYLDRTQWHISLPNFTASPDNTSVVFLENVFLTTDKNTLIGHVAVKNIAFEKQVIIKYTFDNWKTVTELVAEYNDDVRRKRRNNGYDRFSFAINMADLPQHAFSKSLFFCIRYRCDNQEFWDNNGTRNYQVDFSRVVKQKNSISTINSGGPRTRMRRANSADSESRTSLDRVDASDLRLPLTSNDKRNKNQFTSRYDFGSSYSTPTRKSSRHKKTDQLALNAKSYQELIDSYCFFDGNKQVPEPHADKPVWNPSYSVSA